MHKNKKISKLISIMKTFLYKIYRPKNFFSYKTISFTKLSKFSKKLTLYLNSNNICKILKHNLTKKHKTSLTI